MEIDLLQLLQSIEYEGPLLDGNKLSHALMLGPNSTEYIGLVAWLSEEIKSYTTKPISKAINFVTTPNFFLKEVSCFLQEMHCTNQSLTTGDINQRLSTIENRKLLLNILITEVMTVRLSEINYLENIRQGTFYAYESETAKHLQSILTALQFSKTPSNITVELLFSNLENRLKEVISKLPKDSFGRPLFFGKLSTSQWEKLSNFHVQLLEEYEIRRNMLLTRLDVTISCLKNKEISKQEQKEESRSYRTYITQDIKPNVTIVDLLAARDDLAVMEKTSSATVSKYTTSYIKKVVIGDVPDRGGRPYEQEPPPPEMPQWQKDRVAGPSSSGGYGRGGNTGGLGGRGGSGGARGSGRGGRGGGNYGNNVGYGAGGSSGRGGYVNTVSGAGYANAGGSYNQSNNYSGGGDRGNNYGGAGGNYSRGGGRGNNYSNSNYSGGTSYGNNRDRGNYYNSGGAGNRTSGVYHDYNDSAGNYGQNYQHNSGRGGRVQGGWNQGGHNTTLNDYQRDGYKCGRGRGKRQY